eukprot:Mycagemm_TRINITY_DN6519_c0_g1::TRINITY_DN6519_c0_g1_i1::g.71::m.71 type:complete len:137 gc:universal TRINITY_DN6519_c0_g1_i1:229-639(+)
MLLLKVVLVLLANGLIKRAALHHLHDHPQLVLLLRVVRGLVRDDVWVIAVLEKVCLHQVCTLLLLGAVRHSLDGPALLVGPSALKHHAEAALACNTELLVGLLGVARRDELVSHVARLVRQLVGCVVRLFGFLLRL